MSSATIVLMGIGGGCWRQDRRKAAAARRSQKQDTLEPDDHARTREMAELQAELQRLCRPY